MSQWLFWNTEENQSKNGGDTKVYIYNDDSGTYGSGTDSYELCEKLKENDENFQLCKKYISYVQLIKYIIVGKDYYKSINTNIYLEN